MECPLLGRESNVLGIECPLWVGDRKSMGSKDRKFSYQNVGDRMFILGSGTKCPGSNVHFGVGDQMSGDQMSILGLGIKSPGIKCPGIKCPFWCWGSKVRGSNVRGSNVLGIECPFLHWGSNVLGIKCPFWIGD